jgi:hypothetical protein
MVQSLNGSEQGVYPVWNCVVRLQDQPETQQTPSRDTAVRRIRRNRVNYMVRKECGRP